MANFLHVKAYSFFFFRKMFKPILNLGRGREHTKMFYGPKPINLRIRQHEGGKLLDTQDQFEN